MKTLVDIALAVVILLAVAGLVALFAGTLISVLRSRLAGG